MPLNFVFMCLGTGVCKNCSLGLSVGNFCIRAFCPEIQMVYNIILMLRLWSGGNSYEYSTRFDVWFSHLLQSLLSEELFCQMHPDWWEYLYLPCVVSVFIASFVNFWWRRKSYFFPKAGPVAQRNYSSWLKNGYRPNASFRPNIKMPPAENSFQNDSWRLVCIFLGIFIIVCISWAYL